MLLVRRRIVILCLLFVSFTTVLSVCDITEINTLVGSITNLQIAGGGTCADTAGTVCTFECTTGVLQGGSSLTCGDDDEWKGDCPRECTVFTCTATELDGLEPTYDCGGATAPYDLTTECTFSCTLPDQLERSIKATCTFGDSYTTEWCYDGWDQPVCTRMGCTEFVLEYGSCTYSSPRVGAVATCTCNDGFLLEGTSPVTCMESGGTVFWSPDPPRCVPC